jgi:hypothetical protein
MHLIDITEPDISPGTIVRWRHGDAFYAITAVSADGKVTLCGKNREETVLGREWILKDFVRVDFEIPLDSASAE